MSSRVGGAILAFAALIALASTAPRSLRAQVGGEPAQRADPARMSLPAPLTVASGDELNHPEREQAEMPAGADGSPGARSGSAPPAPMSDVDSPPYVENRLLVGFKPGVDPSARKELHEELGGQVIAEISPLDVQVLRFREEDALAMASAYRSRSEIAFAEPDYLAEVMGWPDPTAGAPAALPEMPPTGIDGAMGDLRILRTPNDPQYGSQWHHSRIESAGAWDLTLADEVVVAIVDTGVNCSHEDLSGRCVAGYDYINGDSNPNDDHGHGTHVAGISAASTNNSVGVAGVGWNGRIMPMKALDSTGNGPHSAIANSITWAVDHGADVINMSLGGFFTSSTLRRATEYAFDNGVSLIAAAGNQNTSNPTYPAAYANVVGVAATTQSDGRASFSNYGTYVDVSAPGVAILSTVRTGGYQAWSGTSMASPVVAGLAALLVAQDPGRSPTVIETIMEQTAEDLGETGYDQLFGWGRINARRALEHSPVPGTPGPTSPPAAPTDVPTAPPPTATPSGDFVLQVEELINRERAQVGLSPLHTNAQLRSAAARHSRDMGENGFCGHDGSDGSTAYERMSDAGYPSPYGEVVGCGQTSPAMIVQTWMESPPHKAILLCTLCTELGAGYFNTSSPLWHYWTVTFGRRPVGSEPTPTLIGFPTSAPTPTRTATGTAAPPTPTQAVPEGSETIELVPRSDRIGWVVSSQPSINHFVDETHTYTGAWNGRIYHGAAQFDLAPIPVGAYVNFARLEIVGRTTEFMGSSGTWTANLLDDAIDANFGNEGYTGIHSAAIDSVLLPTLGVDNIGEGVRNTFVMDEAQLAVLDARRSGTGHLSVRMDGPTSGDSINIFTWDSGYGSQTLYPGARLVVNYSMEPATAVPTATPSDTPLPTATETPGPSATPTATEIPPTATFTAPPPPPPTETPTATLPPPPTAPAPGGVVEIRPLLEDVGYVRQLDPGNYFGADNIFAGYYGSRVYFGGIQFDLSAVPPGSAIISARLTLTGQSTRYLSSAGNGLWDVKLLEGAVDRGWRSASYTTIRGAGISSVLQPSLRQADLDVGRENVFVLADIQLRELEFRAATTGKVSFRVDGPSGGLRNVMDWDSGFGSGLRRPPVLQVVYGPPGSGEPLPTALPEDDGRISTVIEEINLVRELHGVAPLAIDGRLAAAAEVHNRDMARNAFFSHVGSDGSTPSERVARVGFAASTVGELLAANNGVPSVVVEAWMTQGQRDAVLDEGYTHIGAHYVFEPGAPYNHYWTVKLARSASADIP